MGALESLRTSNSRSIVVASDVAARGLDITSVTTVVHYDVARVVDTFIHRAGRTAVSDFQLAIMLCELFFCPTVSAAVAMKVPLGLESLIIVAYSPDSLNSISLRSFFILNNQNPHLCLIHLHAARCWGKGSWN